MIYQHRSNFNNENKECPTCVIADFRIHSFRNVRIEILEHVEGKINRLARENDFIFSCRQFFLMV